MVCLALLSLTSCSPTGASADLDFSQIRAATYQVTTDLGSSGTGTLISKNTILTAAHVVARGEKFFVGGKPAKVIKVDPQVDLAVLEVEQDCPCVPLSLSNPAIDTPAYVVGYPLPDQVKSQVLTEGQIQAYVKDDSRVMLNIPVAPGNSGGGVFILSLGKWVLVGVEVEVVQMGSMFMSQQISHLSRAVDLDTIKAFLLGSRK